METCLLAASLAAFAFAPQAALAQAPAQHSKKANARKSATNQAVYNQAIAAVQKGDYATAFKILEPLAKKRRRHRAAQPSRAVSRRLGHHSRRQTSPALV